MQVRNHSKCRLGKQRLTLSATILAALLFLPRTEMLAQGTLARVSGTVRDQTAGPLQGATVMARDPETGRSQTVSSNEEGSFEISQLEPGTYQVQASFTGLVSQTQKAVRLEAGQSVTVSFRLSPGSGEQERSAQGRGSEPGKSSSASAANLISEDQLVGLPLNGRSYSQLATLKAGVSDPSAVSGSRGTGGGGNLNVTGGRGTSNVFLQDGTNIMDTDNRVPRSAAGVQLGSDAVLQVQVLIMPEAQYGRGSGGVLNSITRSGTNELHGTFFEYFRNSKMDARRFFDGPEPPPFKRNQFGFMLTGPVRKGKTFFTGSFEAMRDRLTETKVDFFPDAPARLGFITDVSGNVIRSVSVNPSVMPYLALYPLPNSARRGAGISENVASQFFPTDENFFTIRVDHQIAERDSLFGRYTFDDAISQDTSQGGDDAAFFKTQSTSRQQYVTLVESHIFNPSVLNVFRFGFTRPSSIIEAISSIEIPRSLYFVPTFPVFGQIRIPGLSTFGPFFNPNKTDFMKSIQVADDLIARRGNHEWKFGFEVHRYFWDTFSLARQAGVWTFNNLDSFLQGGPEGTSLVIALPGSDNTKEDRQTLVGLYVQDAYRLSSRWQVNLGLRYEFTTLLHDKYGRNPALPDPVRGSEVQVGSLVANNPSLRNFAPRVGITWSPGSSGNTVLSSGFGVYYDHLFEYVFAIARNTVPYYKSVQKPNFDASTTFPDAVAAAAGMPPVAQTMDYSHFSSPMVMRYNFAIQQRLPGDWRVVASYVGARGNHLFRPYEANLAPVPIIQPDGSLFFPPNAGPLNPAFGELDITATDGQSFYNSLQLSATKRTSRGGTLQASYTFSKTVDDGSTHLVTGNPSQYGRIRTGDRALSEFDVRHRLTINYFYSPPFGKGQRWLSSGVLAALFGAWRLGGIVQFRTGTPFSPQINVRTPSYLFAPIRPNLLAGRSNNPILGGPGQYFDPFVYSVPPPGTLGNAGRNTIIAPSAFTMDISLQREFLLDSKRRLQFRAEFFNLPNHTNFSRPQSTIFSGASGRRNPTAGRIVSTSTTARQVQFALRFSF